MEKLMKRKVTKPRNKTPYSKPPQRSKMKRFANIVNYTTFSRYIFLQNTTS